MSEKLKPCPHCGGEARSVTGWTPKGTCKSFVICTKCETSTKTYFVNYQYYEISKEEAANKAKQEAIAAWNERYTSWNLLMEILDKHYPADVFSDPESQLSKDAGSQIVTKLREINELRAKTKRGR